MKQYRLQPGTSSRIYYLLTVNDDGTMSLYFHGTDRSMTEEATMNENGWIVTRGAIFPPLFSARWNKIDGKVDTSDEHAEADPVRESNGINTEESPSVCEAPLYNNCEITEQQTSEQRAEETDAAEPVDHSERNIKIFAVIGTAAAVVILLNIVGPFGLAALGFLSCGLLR